MVMDIIIMAIHILKIVKNKGNAALYYTMLLCLQNALDFEMKYACNLSVC